MIYLHFILNTCYINTHKEVLQTGGEIASHFNVQMKCSFCSTALEGLENMNQDIFFNIMTRLSHQQILICEWAISHSAWYECEKNRHYITTTTIRRGNMQSDHLKSVVQRKNSNGL